MTKKHKYTEEQLQNAINEYKLTGLLRQTARSFKIPVMTLHDRVFGKVRLNRGFSQTYLSKQTGELMVHSLLIMAEWGFGFVYRNLKAMVAKYLELNQLSHLFGQSGEPGTSCF